MDWDLLARTPGIDRLDVVATDRVLAGALHERMHQRAAGHRGGALRTARAAVRAGTGVFPISDELRCTSTRDREEEVAGVRAAGQEGALRDGRLSHARSRRRSSSTSRCRMSTWRERFSRPAGVPCQLFDALPLAAEPYAAALDLVLTFVGSGLCPWAGRCSCCSRRTSIVPIPTASLPANDIAALDRALTENGYLGDIEALGRLMDAWNACTAAPPGSCAGRDVSFRASPASWRHCARRRLFRSTCRCCCIS